MIPKTIHYCWFGKGEMTSLEKKCIASWKKYCPDYQIKLWNEENFPIDYCDFTKEAYRIGKYAFVSDVARLYAIQKEGGIYFDTDILLIKTIPTNFMNNDLFIGMETSQSLSAGVIGAVSNNENIIKILDFYKIIREVPGENITIPIVLNSIIEFEEIQTFKKKMSWGLLLHKDVFYPLPFKLKKILWKKFVKKETIGVHLWIGSWKKKSSKNIVETIKYHLSKIYIPKYLIQFAKNI